MIFLRLFLVIACIGPLLGCSSSPDEGDGAADAAGNGGSGAAEGMVDSGGQGGTAQADSGPMIDSGTPTQDMAIPTFDGAAVRDAVARDMAMPVLDGATVRDAVAQDMAVFPAAPCGDNCPELDFVAITGGEFQMGSNELGPQEQPVHPVNISNFELMRAEVTVAQYRACVTANACHPPGCSDFNTIGRLILCNYSQNRDDHPVNFVSWINAQQFAAWASARLPSESEWEYAARSQGQNITYPWGDDEPTCDHAEFDPGDDSCGANGTSPVCTHAAGHSAQGVCDLVGNVYEWTQDEWHLTYEGAPDDGSSWGEDANNGAGRITRGGSWGAIGINIQAANRGGYEARRRDAFGGFRLARSLPDSGGD